MYEEDFDSFEDIYDARINCDLKKNVGRIYYRWKSAADHEWVEMTGKEYYDFIRSEEGKKHFFVAEVDPDHETDTIVHEATQTEFRKWNSERTKYWQLEKDIHDITDDKSNTNHDKENIHRRKMPLVYNITSLDNKVNSDNEDENFPLHEMLVNPDSLFEERLVLKIAINELIGRLNPEEKEVVTALYFDNPDCLNERHIATKLGLPLMTFNDRKNRALKKMRKFL